jgi:hypothetical protein
MESGVFEKADLKANGDNLTEIGRGREIFVAGAEVGEAKMAGARKFQARGEDGGVKINDGAKLDLETELHGGGGESLAVEDPASAVGKGRGECGKEAVALFIAITLDFERLHKGRASVAGDDCH